MGRKAEKERSCWQEIIELDQSFIRKYLCEEMDTSDKRGKILRLQNKIPIRILASIFIIVLFLNQSCLVSPYAWQIKVDQEYVKPDLDYSLYKNLAVPKFNKRPPVEDEAVEKFTHFVMEEFSEKGYKIVASQELGSFLSEKRLSKKDLEDSEALRKMRDFLGANALICGVVDQYEIRPEILADPITQVNIRMDTEFDVFNICDVGLTIEMVDTEDGAVIWSSFVYTHGGKIKGNPEWLLRRMVKECLKTFPKQ
jgi:hypothetical protein